MIKEIHIQNFKCHKSLRTGLGLGITIFVAPNGRGKSTVAEAIAWCLFGPHAISASQDRIVTHGETDCSVRVLMDIQGEEHRFTRTYKMGGTATADVYKHGELMGHGPSGVAEYLNDLGIDLDGFNMVYAQQGELAYFVNATPAIRKQLIASLLQLDKFDGMLKQIRADVVEQEEQLSDIPQREDIVQLIAQTDELKVAVARGMAEAAQWENAIVECTGAVNLYRDMLTDPQIQEAREQIISQAAAFESMHQKHLNDRKDWEKAAKRHMLKPEELEDGVAAEVDELEGKVACLGVDIIQLEMEIEAVFVLVVDVKTGICPLCTGEVENPQELIDGTIHDNVSDLEDRLSKKRNALKITEVTLTRKEKVLKDIRQMWDSYDLHEKEVANAIEQLAICEEQVQETKREADRLRGELKKLGPDQFDVREALKDAEDELTSLNKQFTAAIAAKRIAQHKLDAIENHAAEIDTLLRGSELQRRKLGRLQELKKSMPEFRDLLLSQSLSWVAERASGLLLRATGNPWPLKIDTDLGFWVNDIPLEDFSSGQVDMVCVCLRIAVAEFLAKRIGMRGLMILDGVFDRIDEDNRDAIGRLVGEINVPQILLLSHFEVPVIEGERFTF